jgi:hypothetical protein
MRMSRNYETDDSIVSVKPVPVDSNPKQLAFITIYAAANKVHISGRYIPELRAILEEIEKNYELIME